jgi:predicted CopG family antitoxin
MGNISKQKYTNIAVTETNYLALKRLGQTGDSFNDVLTRLLEANGNK